MASEPAVRAALESAVGEIQSALRKSATLTTPEREELNRAIASLNYVMMKHENAAVLAFVIKSARALGVG